MKNLVVNKKINIKNKVSFSSCFMFTVALYGNSCGAIPPVNKILSAPPKNGERDFAINRFVFCLLFLEF